MHASVGMYISVHTCIHVVCIYVDIYMCMHAFVYVCIHSVMYVGRHT